MAEIKVKDLGDLKSFDVFTGGNNFLPVQGNVAMQSFSVPEGQKWDESNFIKGFTDFFDKLGAKKIWEGKIPDEAKEALNNTKGENSEKNFDLHISNYNFSSGAKSR